MTTEMESEAIRQAAIRMLRSGQTPKEVATALGCSRAWVHKWRKRFERDR